MSTVYRETAMNSSSAYDSRTAGWPRMYSAKVMKWSSAESKKHTIEGVREYFEKFIAELEATEP